MNRNGSREASIKNNIKYISNAKWYFKKRGLFKKHIIKIHGIDLIA